MSGASSAMARVAAAHNVHCVLMHNRHADDPRANMFDEVCDFLARSIEMALTAGVAKDKIIVDPGIGFGKTAAQGFDLVRRLPELKAKLGCPILLGVSRKRLIGAATGKSIPAERDAGSVAAGLWGAMHGADIVRVHDAASQADAFRVLAAIEGKLNGPNP
jgi:dihydropteroate synthase